MASRRLSPPDDGLVDHQPETPPGIAGSHASKYTFRCWLLRLGFIGEEFETARMHLTKRLPGNAAWRRAA